MIKKIDHIAIACNSLDNQIPFYRDVLGLEYEGDEVVEEQKVKVAFFSAGDVRIELLEPTTEDSPISKFLEKKGEGIHHIAYQVDGVEKSLDEMKAKDVRLIDETPRKGAHGNSIAFLHPKSSMGVLTEFCAKE